MAKNIQEHIKELEREEDSLFLGLFHYAMKHIESDTRFYNDTAIISILLLIIALFAETSGVNTILINSSIIAFSTAIVYGIIMYMQKKITYTRKMESYFMTVFKKNNNELTTLQKFQKGKLDYHEVKMYYQIQQVPVLKYDEILKFNKDTANLVIINLIIFGVIMLALSLVK